MSADPRGPSGTGHDTSGRRCGLHQVAGEHLPCPVCTEMTEPPPVAVPGPASVSPADTAESDRMLLVALGMLLSWRVVRYEENMGGGWFSASEFGTHPIRADEVRRLYAKESEARRGR